MTRDVPFLQVRAVSKVFGNTVANRDVDLSVAAGEVVGVLGENGAGKTTLMNIISGLLAADSGEIFVAGRCAAFASPRDAAEAGIGMVHQHFKLVGALTVAENIALGDSRWGRGRLRLDVLRREIGRIAERLGIQVDFDRRVDALTIGEQQRVEILKVLARSPRLLILDEPTAVLTPDERSGLFAMIAELARSGTAVIIISHKLEDILEACQRVIVMRGGRVVDAGPVRGRSRADLVRMVVGEDLPPTMRKSEKLRPRKPLVDVENLTIRRANGTFAARNVSFRLTSDEILGLCGVDGNGQSELIAAITGMRRPDGGRIQYHLPGAPADGWLDAAVLRRLGLCHVPEDRHRHGIVEDLALPENFLLTQLDVAQFNFRGWLQHRRIINGVAAAIADFEVKAESPRAGIAQLSGGNQQKFVLAREFANTPSVIVAAHPTRGLDVRTIVFIKQRLLDARARGAGVLLLSSELAEIWDIVDRIMVMAGGRLLGPVSIAATSPEEIGHWMTAR
jgi:ABC-type uncharacterized transport system ATPase subunit